jgi:serine/threonine protein kinase
MSEQAVGVGSELAKKYRVGRLLGEGGMATVFEGEHMRLGQKVAIKVLHEDLASNVELIARFEREGRALSKLKSRHVVRVFDVDEAPNGVPFLVMERLEGTDLAEELGARGALPIAEAVGYVMQACSAMEEAHAVGIVHRDLKPSNLFLTTEGGTRIVKVLDFGIAMDALPEHGARLTETSAVMGTPVYMAPEQFRRTRDVDGRADIWALGATLYEMLTGSPPFSGTANTIGVAVVTDDFPPIEDSRPDAPAALRAVIARTLEKDPAKRFATMRELADALAPFGDTVIIAPRSSPRVSSAEALGRASTRPVMTAPLHAPPPETRPDAVKASTPAPELGAEAAPSRSSSRRRVVLGAAVIAAVAGASALFVATRAPPGARTAPGPAASASSAASSSSSPSPFAPTSASVGVVPLVPPPLDAAATASQLAPGDSRLPPPPSTTGVAPRTSAGGRPSATQGGGPPSAKPSAKPPTGNAPPLFFPGQ